MDHTQVGRTWLVVGAVLIGLTGVFLLLIPQFVLPLFGWMLYADTQRLASFGQEPLRYIMLLHAVLGSVLIGWAVLIWWAVKRVGQHDGYLWAKAVGASVFAWAIPDTAYSLLSGFWQNAVFNLIFIAVFTVGLRFARQQPIQT